MREAMLQEIGTYTAHGRIVDLGSGWGGLAAEAAAEYPDRQVIGLEMAPFPYLFSKLWYRGNRRPGNLTFLKSDFRELEPEEWTVYLAYLSPLAMETLRRRFETKPPRNAVLISALFSVRPWTPVKSVRARDIHRTNIHVYEIRGVGAL